MIRIQVKQRWWELVLTKPFIAVVVMTVLASCGGSATPTPQPTILSEYVRPPNVPKGGFPLLEIPLQGQIIFSNGTSLSITAVDAEASPTVLYATNADLIHPSWSSDGKQIVYVRVQRDYRDTNELVLANADGSNPSVLLSTKVYQESFKSPVFSRDGRYIFFNHTDALQASAQRWPLKLKRLDLQTQEIVEIADQAMDAAVRPDGQHIAFVHVSPVRSDDLWLSDLDGKNTTTLLTGRILGRIANPHWSPDGDSILFASSSGADFLGPVYDFWIVDTTDKKYQPLTNIGERAPNAAFSPDGKHFAFIGSEGIYIVEVATQKVQRLQARGSPRGGLDWRK